jgi:MFS family permease
VLNVMLSGVVLNLVCIGIAVAGVEVAHFWWALVLLGVGWNFMFIAATALLTETYRPAEKARVQGLNDLLIFVTMATSSFASGMILERNGWQTLNYAAVPFVVAVGVAAVWLTLKRKSAVATA